MPVGRYKTFMAEACRDWLPLFSRVLRMSEMGIGFSESHGAAIPLAFAMSAMCGPGLALDACEVSGKQRPR